MRIAVRMLLTCKSPTHIVLEAARSRSSTVALTCERVAAVPLLLVPDAPFRGGSGPAPRSAAPGDPQLHKEGQMSSKHLRKTSLLAGLALGLTALVAGM